MENLDFHRFHVGTLFLVRTPEVFPVGYPDECFADMKQNLHMDYAALLETWNCEDGIVWKSPKFPRSSFWKDCERDPVEECFQAADKYGMAFLPEAGMMDKAYMLAHPEGMQTDGEGRTSRFGRIGLVPACPLTLEYLIEKYDTMLEKFGGHPSCRGICMPCENGVNVSFDRYTREAWKSAFGTNMPTQAEILADEAVEDRVNAFMEHVFLEMYRKLARHLKQKYGLPLMHYPLDVISGNSFCQPAYAGSGAQGNVSVMNRVEDLDMLNLQLHPPLNPNPYFFKFETEFLMGNAVDKPCMTDTHFYHEGTMGRLPDTTTKRTIDNVLSTVTPYGVSFFCYGFMRQELPLWKKELNPGAPVYRVYEEAHTLAARRESCLKAMDYVQRLSGALEGTRHSADLAFYYPEEINHNYKLGSYPLEHAFGAYELLNAACVPLRFVRTVPTDPAESKCLVFDCVRELPAEDLEALRRYTAAGGRVILIGKCAGELEALAGLRVEEAAGRFVVSPESDDYRSCLVRLPESGRHYRESEGTPLLRYENGEPAVTEKGNWIFIGFSDAVDRFSDYRDARAASWLRKLLFEKKLNSGVEFHNIHRAREDWHQFVSADLYAGETKKMLLLRNYGVELRSSTLRWDAGEGYAVLRAEADGKEFSFTQGGALPEIEHYLALYAEKTGKKA